MQNHIAGVVSQTFGQCASDSSAGTGDQTYRTFCPLAKHRFPRLRLRLVFRNRLRFGALSSAPEKDGKERVDAPFLVRSQA
jgi:hypothetical protein